MKKPRKLTSRMFSFLPLPSCPFPPLLHPTLQSCLPSLQEGEKKEQVTTWLGRRLKFWISGSSCKTSLNCSAEQTTFCHPRLHPPTTSDYMS